MFHHQRFRLKAGSIATTLEDEKMIAAHFQRAEIIAIEQIPNRIDTTNRQSRRMESV